MALANSTCLCGKKSLNCCMCAVTLNNASDSRANGLLSDCFGWTIRLTD